MKVERSVTRLLRRGGPEREEPSPLPPAELVGVVWELTAEAYSLAGNFDAEARLPRHVVRLIRNKQSTGRDKDRLDARMLLGGE